MGMKKQDVYDLMDRFVASGIARMKYASGDTVLEFERDAPAPAIAPGPMPLTVAPASAAGGPAAPVAPAQPAPAAAPVSPATPLEEQGSFVTAPLVGTFYVAPSPDKDPYVQPGDHVKRGDTVCLLEAMKMMSEVTAPCDCVIEEIVATDGELVSFGAPLIRYRED